MLLNRKSAIKDFGSFAIVHSYDEARSKVSLKLKDCVYRPTEITAKRIES